MAGGGGGAERRVRPEQSVRRLSICVALSSFGLVPCLSAAPPSCPPRPRPDSVPARFPRRRSGVPAGPPLFGAKITAPGTPFSDEAHRDTASSSRGGRGTDEIVFTLPFGHSDWLGRGQLELVTNLKRRILTKEGRFIACNDTRSFKGGSPVFPRTALVGLLC